MRVRRFSVRITTGGRGPSTPPRFCFNGHVLPFEETSGEARAAGDVFEGSFEPHSFAHHLSIEGPTGEDEVWEIARIDVKYEIEGDEPYEVHLGAVTLDATSCVDIWRERPIPAFDV